MPRSLACCQRPEALEDSPGFSTGGFAGDGLAAGVFVAGVFLARGFAAISKSSLFVFAHCQVVTSSAHALCWSAGRPKLRAGPSTSRSMTSSKSPSREGRTHDSLSPGPFKRRRVVVIGAVNQRYGHRYPVFESSMHHIDTGRRIDEMRTLHRPGKNRIDIDIHGASSQDQSAEVHDRTSPIVTGMTSLTSTV